MKHYKYIIEGATAFAVGLCSALADAGIPTLIIDRGSIVAGEFAAALKGGGAFAYTPVSDSAKKLKEELLERDIISVAGDSLPPLEPVFAGLLAKYSGKAELLANASVISNAPTASCRRLEVYTIGGVYGFTADYVLDTTSRGRINSHTINAGLSIADIPEEFGITAGRFKDEAYLRYSVPLETDYSDARAALSGYWRSRPAGLAGAQLVHIADRFDDNCGGGIILRSGREYSLPSASYASALEAFDSGVIFADKIGGVMK